MSDKKPSTSTKVRDRWNAKTYKQFVARLRKVEDAELIAFVEQSEHSVTEIFRVGIAALREKEK